MATLNPFDLLDAALRIRARSPFPSLQISLRNMHLFPPSLLSHLLRRGSLLNLVRFS
ncbi:unnamed protein product [Brassica oleracea var. botrytis]